jgi:formylglycine-generating enzyme required for sulfatase activity
MKPKLHLLVIVLALIPNIHPVLAQITNLNIAPAGNQTVLFWPATIANYVLQSTTNLSSTNWVAVTNTVLVTAVTVTNTSPTRYFRLHITSNTPPTNGMAFVPAGSFTMGDSLDGESDATPTIVTVSAFYMDTNLVNNAQWVAVLSWALNHGYSFDDDGAAKATNHPVQTVNWYDVVKWCNARSLLAGLIPVYYTDTNLTQIYTNGDVDAVNANWAASGFRLPTEAEWEKAARGGAVGLRFPWGDTISESHANYYSNTNLCSSCSSYDLGPSGYNATFTGGGPPYTSPVGSFAANGYGLYDMAGNALEWCWDWYGTPYAGGPDPRGPASGGVRILRGGSWSGLASIQRCAYRNDTPPNSADYNIGFRCVRSP